MVVQVYKHNPFLAYLKMGYLLHLMTLVELIIIIVCFQNFKIGGWLNNGNFILKSVGLFLFVSAPIFPQCDARSRFQNYKQVKDHLYLYGFQARIIKPFASARCQRDAVIAAAEELGLEKLCKQYFRDQGYRWYHILPEFLFYKPSYLFKKAFWLNTFFAKYYHPKVNFSALEKEKMILNENECYLTSSII